jgi:hypothetical protein
MRKAQVYPYKRSVSTWVFSSNGDFELAFEEVSHGVHVVKRSLDDSIDDTLLELGVDDLVALKRFFSGVVKRCQARGHDD